MPLPYDHIYTFNVDIDRVNRYHTKGAVFVCSIVENLFSSKTHTDRTDLFVFDIYFSFISYPV